VTPIQAGGFEHGLGFFGSDDEFAATFTPFCRDALEQDAPVVVRVADRYAELLRDDLGPDAGVVFAAQGDQYQDPPGALRNAIDLIERHSHPTRPVYLLGELPPMTGLGRDAWVRYEAAANRVLDQRRVKALCATDTRGLDASLKDDLLRSHHVIVDADGSQPNPAFTTPEVAAAARTPVRDPLEHTSPALQLHNPTPGAARHAVARLAAASGVRPAQIDDLLVGLSEVLGNAIRHGTEPVQVSAWSVAGKVVVAVRDSGSGPADPFVGLLPQGEPGERVGGLGLWISHRLCPQISLSVDASSFTVRMAVEAAA